MKNTSYSIDDTKVLPAEVLEGANGVTFSGLDPILGSVGEMIGLLDKLDQGPDTYGLNNQWFTDPIENTRTGFTNNASNFSDLLAQVLGKVGGNALGIPVTDPALLGTWYPITYNEQETGLYFVTYQKEEETVLGVGILHSWEVPTATPLIKVDVWGMLPFVRVGKNEVNITFNKEGYPITFGIALEGADPGKPLVDINDVQFNGVKVNASIDMASATPFEITIQALALKLPGDPVPTDRTLADLEAITGQQILETASSLFVGALSNVFTQTSQQTRISYFPPLIGLTSIVPNSQSRLPVLAWSDLFKIAANPSQYPQGVATPFLNWFNTLSANPDQLKTWLSCFGSFLNGTQTDVTGAGTRINPFTISMISVNGIGKLNFTVGTDVVGDGIRYFYPGLSFTGTDIPISTSDIVFNVEADLELARFQLTGGPISADPTVNFQFKGRMGNKTEGQPLAAFDGYSFGSLEGGMSFGLSGSVVPYFNLNNVVTPSSSFNVINLLSPSQLANAGAVALSDGIKTLLSLSSSNTFSSSVASLIGLTPPDSAGSNWPIALLAPFDASQMINSITNPLEAWAKYYLNILEYVPLVDGKTAFTYIVKEFGQLLNSATGSDTVTVTGDGTPDSPWKAGISLTDVTLPAYLTSYSTALDGGGTRLFIGLSLEPELTLLGTKVVPSIKLDVVNVDIPAGGNGTATAQWLPLVAAQLTLPDGFQTPDFAGITIKIDQSQLSGSWSRAGGWGWSLFVNNPTLVIDGNSISLNQNLNFADPAALEKLVTDGVATFAPFLTGALGAFLLRTNTRAGLFTAGAFGFLTDLSKSPIFPAGFSWDGFTQLKLTSFTDPWPALRQQIAADFDTTDKAKSMLGMLSWTINTGLATPPNISGNGSFTDPYLMPLPAGFELPVWYDDSSKVIGLGIGRDDVYDYSIGSTKFRFNLQTRLNAIEYSLDQGSVVYPNNCPNLSFLGTLSNPDGLLIDLPLGAGSVNKVILGFTLSIVSGSVTFTPVVTMLGVTLAGQTELESLTLEEILDPSFSASLQASFYTILNAAVQAAIDQVKDVEGFKTAYNLLSLLGLVTTWDENATPNGGINTSGWNGLLSDFNTYIQRQLTAMLVEPTQRAELFAFLESTFGITIPAFPTSMLDLLAALQICGPADEGYLLIPQALLELASDPVNSIKNRFVALFENAEVLAALTKELTANIPAVKYGNFTFGSNSNGVVSLQVLPTDAFKIGSFLNLSGGLQLDLINKDISVDINVYCPILGLALDNVITLRYPLTTDDIFHSAMVWGDGSKPSAAPLPLYPFKSDEFLINLSNLAPAYVLNIISNAVLEESLLKKYPLVQQIFTGLGLAAEAMPAAEGGILASAVGQWDMQSIMGILKDPLGWMLSDDVLGHNGRFNVGALAALLSNLPQVTSDNGITVTPGVDGAEISGLPYGLAVNITGQNGLATFGFSADPIVIAGGKGKLDNLGMQITLDANYQPAFAGSVDLSSDVAGNIFATVGYDKGFLLKIAQGVPAAPSGLALQLLPFLGWGNIAGQAASFAAAYMVNDLTPKLLDYLATTAAGPFITQMRTFGTAVDVNALIQSLLQILTVENFQQKTQSELLTMVENAALTWLKGLFSTAQAPNTANAVKTLLSGLLPTQLTTDGGLILFNPGNSIPVVIKAGLNSQNLLGLWADLTLPSLEIIDIKVAETGAGIDINSGAFTFNFGVDILLPVEGTTGPAISLQYDANKGFVLGFDPISDAGTNSALARELLPEFFPKMAGDPDELLARMNEWIFGVFKNVIPRYISSLVLNLGSVKAWLEAPIIGDGNAPTPVFLLEAASLVVQETKGSKVTYYLNSIDNLLAITPEVFFGNFLKALMSNTLTLLTFGEDNKSTIKIGPELNNPGSYGLHLFAPNLKIPSIPNIVIQLGDSDNEWITDSGGVTGDPGIGIYVPINMNGTIPSVDFSMLNLVLNNVGFDMVGTNGKPLVDLSRFAIGAVKPRVLFDLKLNNGNPTVDFGAGVTLQDIALSLAPNKMAPGGDSSTNPIASNLLGSGDDKSANNPPANPAFSVTAAYTKQVYVNLKSNTGNGTQVIVPIQRSFGPLFVDSLGLGWENTEKILDFLFSGSVELAGLKTTLIGLTIGVPVETPTDFSAYKLDLQGLDISFEGGSVSVEAGLFKQTNPLCYNGTAVIKGGKFSVLALGSYAEIENSKGNKEPSLFIFGVLNVPLGGPPAFFVTGIAAGFSYNRGLIIPAIDQVQNFPLVKGLSEGSFTSNDPAEALKQLSDFVPPQIGQYWLAAGIKFKSFGLINTSALLFLSFGKEWELNILGLSYATLPPEIPQNLALAYFELAIKVSFKFTAGIISAEAQLTPNSFVLTRDCRVTGGFAFYLWYKKQVTDAYTVNAGDFVISLGGYHPAFAVPVYYPVVPRLGMVWKMEIAVGKISISGGAYFALCPTAVMAGGYLNVNFELGPLSAWLNAYANFLIEWNPFYFKVGIGVTVGVSFGTTIAGVSVTLSAELGTKLNLEGPPVHGSVEVDWYVISFTIPIGSGETATDDNPITWELFEQSFLPAPEKSNDQQLANADVSLAVEENTTTEIVKWSSGEGMQSTNADSALWIVNPVPFTVSVQSAIPVSDMAVTGTSFSASGVPVGVRPMGYVNTLDAPFTIVVLDEGGKPVDLVARQVSLTVITNGAPSALWSKEQLNKAQAPNPNTMLIADALFGLTLSADQYVITGNIPAFNVENLKYDRNDIKLLPFALTPTYPAAALYTDQRAYTIIRQSIMDSAVIQKRNAAFLALSASAILAPQNPDLSVMAFSPELILQDLPVIARIGIYQNGGVPEQGNLIPSISLNAPLKKSEIVIALPRLQGVFNKYATNATPMAPLFSNRAKLSLNASEGILSMPLYRRNIRASFTNKTAINTRSQYASKLATDEPKNYITLNDGKIAMWLVDPNATTSINNQGGLPVLIFSFDRFSAIIGLKYLEPGVQYVLPPDTAQVVVQGYGLGDDANVGWQRNTLLAKVNPVWALADGSMIRVQNSQRIKVPDTGLQIGLLDANALLVKNQVSGVRGLEPGWIQSLFPSSAKYIAILTDALADDADTIGVSILAGAIPSKTNQNKPVQVITKDSKTLSVYETPEACATDSFYGVIAKPASMDLNVWGMYALSSLDHASIEGWSQLCLDYGAVDLAANDNRSSKITITSK
ncbi:DUF6603 domain-containing protein [Mucilaginibacter sp. KACC 22063]|uniref:DUF6603 domain-containing protein n=1 Tax=Mucilaginibacter sp. KACC 22063 TaxID=3025666 RepID=UPI002365BA4D|nr:DUF6603 domain-containing protein [Mucilaginibacter sp. KACC 22063]WDF57257.1 hypothetical protein PQ461_09350 [Mucilaginibacter sp. KACC 22063]